MRTGRLELATGIVVPLLLILACGESGGGDGGESGGGGEVYTGPNMTEDDAIGYVKVYLEEQSRVTTEERQYSTRVMCFPHEIDAGLCQQDADGIWRRATVQYETIQIPGPCLFPPVGGYWNAEYSPSSQTWRVTNTLSETGDNAWTVDDRTGEVMSDQPPC